MIMNESEIYPYEATDISDRDCIVIAPHPDDESIGCGGSIVKHTRKGSRVKVIFLTKGDKGDFKGIFGSEYQNLRRKSAVEALTFLGVRDFEFWEFKDRELLNEKDVVYKKLKASFENFKPELIYTPSPYEAHPDHRVAASIGWQLYKENNIDVAFYEVLMPLYPNILVDISDEFKAKESAIKCYKTELFYNDYFSRVEGLNRFRASTLNSDVKYAEALLMAGNEAGGKDLAVRLLRHLMGMV